MLQYCLKKSLAHGIQQLLYQHRLLQQINVLLWLSKGCMKTRGLQDTNISCEKQARLGGDAREPRAFLPCPTLLQGEKSENQINLFLPIRLQTLHQLTRKVKEMFHFEQGKAIDVNKLLDRSAFANLFPHIKLGRAN